MKKKGQGELGRLGDFLQSRYVRCIIVKISGDIGDVDVSFIVQIP